MLVSHVLGMVDVSVHSLGVAVVTGKVVLSVHSERLNVGIVVAKVWQVTVVVVRSKGTDFVVMKGDVVVVVMVMYFVERKVVTMLVVTVVGFQIVVVSTASTGVVSVVFTVLVVGVQVLPVLHVVVFEGCWPYCP